MTMTCAEFKCLRESMGLSTKWLSIRWDVSECSVKRWERNRLLPETLERDMRNLKTEFDEEVRRMVTKVDNSPVEASIIVPRVNIESNSGTPAAWHRAIAQRVSEMCRVRILFHDDECISCIDGDDCRSSTSA